MSDPMKISSNLKTFIQALEDGKRVSGDKQGSWFCEGVGKKIIRKFLRNEDHRIAKIGKAFNAYLEEIEKTPVIFNSANQSLKKKEYKELLQAADKVRRMLNKYKSHTKVKRQLELLDYQETGVKYRIESCNGGLNKIKGVLKNESDSIVKLAQEWKEDQDLYEDKSLLESEKSKVQEACRYPKFQKLLENNKSLRDAFFKWTIRGNIDVGPFVQFPAKCKELNESLFSGRLGRFAHPCLSIEKKQKGAGGQKKILTLPFEVQEDKGIRERKINILNENKQVVLRGNYKLEMKEIFKEFREKKARPTHLEFLDGKICNYSALELGWWDPSINDYRRVDLSDKGWWKKLPIFERITKEDLKAQYGIEELQEGSWAAIAASSRESPTLNVDKTHGYLIIAIPEKDGLYRIYPFGKLAATYPNTFVEKYLFIGNTSEARIFYPDESVFYSQRQHALVKPFIISPAKGEKLMNLICQDILRGRKGNLVFQFAWENCAFWSQRILEILLGKKSKGGKVSNFFLLSVTKSDIRFINPFLKFADKLPEITKRATAKMPKKVRFIARDLSNSLRWRFLRIVESFLLTWRGMHVEENGKKVWKSASTSPLREKYRIFHPGYLHKQILDNKLTGKVSMGHHHFLKQSKPTV